MFLTRIAARGNRLRCFSRDSLRFLRILCLGETHVEALRIGRKEGIAACNVESDQLRIPTHDASFVIVARTDINLHIWTPIANQRLCLRRIRNVSQASNVVSLIRQVQLRLRRNTRLLQRSSISIQRDISQIVPIVLGSHFLGDWHLTLVEVQRSRSTRTALQQVFRLVRVCVLVAILPPSTSTIQMSGLISVIHASREYFRAEVLPQRREEESIAEKISLRRAILSRLSLSIRKSFHR